MVFFSFFLFFYLFFFYFFLFFIYFFFYITLFCKRGFFVIYFFTKNKKQKKQKKKKSKCHPCYRRLHNHRLVCTATAHLTYREAGATTGAGTGRRGRILGGRRRKVGFFITPCSHAPFFFCGLKNVVFYLFFCFYLFIFFLLLFYYSLHVK